MMKKKIVIILAAVVVVAGTVSGVVAQRYVILPADIKVVNIWVSESWPQKYYVHVEAGGPDSCWKPWKYVVLRFGNVIFVGVLTLHDRERGCQMVITYEDKVVELGRLFIPGMKYLVIVNDVTEIFTGGRCEQIPRQFR